MGFVQVNKLWRMLASISNILSERVINYLYLVLQVVHIHPGLGRDAMAEGKLPLLRMILNLLDNHTQVHPYGTYNKNDILLAKQFYC